MKVESKVILYIAMSLDGYIARKDGSVDWLDEDEEEEETGYLDFYKTIDTIVMGRKTYEQVMSFGDWVYKGKKNYVLTSNKVGIKENSDVEIVDEDTAAFINKLKLESKSNIWLLGGAETVNVFLDEELIDEFRIAVIPVILGEGIRLFTSSKEQKLKLADTKRYGNIVELKYMRNKLEMAGF